MLIDAAGGRETASRQALDLLMLMFPGGRERTEPEWRNLLARAGFTLNRIVPTKAPDSVIEALPR